MCHYAHLRFTVGNPQKEDVLICVGSTKNTKKEHSKKKEGLVLYPLGLDLNKKNSEEDTRASSSSRNGEARRIESKTMKIRSYSADKPSLLI